MCCPPAPDARYVSISKSFSLISMSISSASGNTATVTVDVWIRPEDSVSGTRCTRCTPLSNFNLEYTLSPSMENTTSLKPPNSGSFASMMVHLQPCVSAYFVNMRNKSPANKAASSPPAPPRISTIIFLSSFGSFGNSKICNSASNSSRRTFNSFNSSCAIARKSSSRLLSPSTSNASSMPAKTCLY